MNRKIVRDALLAWALVVVSVAMFGATGPQVKTQSGIVEGKDDGTMRAFLGIPYAAPPVGDLRWKPPMPAAKWDSVRKVTEFGSHCMQGNVYDDMVFHDPGGSEDCLSLNVWVPDNTKGKLPVMVWIYGGGFMAGTTSEGRQDGENLAKQGVIVVSMNYRLGIFGFFTNAELSKESGHHASGNYGLLDQLAALRWVHENIAAFGGDPGNVTIFGESAGSFSVSALMASPLAKGLFQKAIGESGAAFFSSGLSFQPHQAREKEDTKAVSEKLGVHTLAEFRAVPGEKLLELFGMPGWKGGHDFGPDVDGYFLPESAPAIFAAHKQNDVALLAGWNHDEDSFEIASDPKKQTAESLKATAKKDFGGKAKEFLQLYPSGTPEQAIRSAEDYAGDHFIAWSTWEWMEAQSKTGKKPIYRYRFDLPFPSDSKGPSPGAYHSAEIEYVFGQLDSKSGVTWRQEDRQLSELMQKYWSNFAKSSDPNGAGLPKWPVYSSSDGWPVMFLDAQSAAHKDDLRPRYLFLQSQWAK